MKEKAQRGASEIKHEAIDRRADGSILRSIWGGIGTHLRGDLSCPSAPGVSVGW